MTSSCLRYGGSEAVKYATIDSEELGLDTKKFYASLDSGKYKAQVERNRDEAKELNVKGVPSFLP
jgi:predicted DsbA family dithiol-disulfide isomerase